MNLIRTDLEAICKWGSGKIYREVTGVLIDTGAGMVKAEPGDWIIKGVKGEFYPCKPDIFEETYEEV